MDTEIEFDEGKVKEETVKLLRENIAKSRVSIRKTIELRSFLFHAVHRGLPLSTNHITSDFLAGNHEKNTVKPLSQYVFELEQVQRQLESFYHYIYFCEKEIKRILASQSKEDIN